MELNLKKARKLDAKIQNFLDTNSIHTKASIRVRGTLEDAKTSIKKSNEEVRETIHERLSLLDARFDIRRQIEKKNEESGINDLMNVRANKLKAIDELAKLGGDEALSEEDLADKLKVAADSLNNPDSYDNRTVLHVDVFTEQELESFADSKAKLQRQIEDIDDEIIAKNASNKITLSDDVLKLLQSKRLM
jgi:hypothetical protein